MSTAGTYKLDRDLAIDIASGFIAKEEGFRSKAYWDVNGYAIAYGNHYYADGTPVKQGDTVSLAEGKKLLPIIVKDKERAIYPSIKAPVNENKEAALVDIAYNCGEGNVTRSELLRLINNNAGDKAVADQFVKTCVTADGKFMQQLYDRRVRGKNLYFSSLGLAIRKHPYASVGIAAAVVIVAGYYAYRIAKAS